VSVTSEELFAIADNELQAIEAIRKSDFGRDLLAGLSKSPRSISPKYFYDAAGSALFDRICELPEYYPTRTELAILKANAIDIVQHIGPHANIIEFGAGSLEKIRVLLDAFPMSSAPDRYLPVDISAGHLDGAARKLRAAYRWLDVQPLAADYMKPEQLHALSAISGRRVGFFPGSTIGNFTPDETAAFLRNSARLLKGGGMLIGVDLIKDLDTLHRAYNDAEGVTAQFNLNLLVRANTELGANFDLSAFAHQAFFNPLKARIEMHLVSLRAQTVRVGSYDFRFDDGETIHTENSHKYTLDSFREVAAAAGFKPGAVWTDDAGLFSLHWLDSPAA
jgi:L-histidine N-alpha-methyltransferase